VSTPHRDHHFLPRSDLDRLLAALQASGYRCVGPQVRDGAIVFDDLPSAAALPQGVHDQQGPGQYRLQAGEGERQFAWANGPQAVKPLTFVPRETLWRSRRDEAGQLTFEPVDDEARAVAVIGVRACDLAALAIQDRHFLGGVARDPAYAARRERLLLVAVNCSHPAATCFCASTGDGPGASDGYDLVMDELDDGFLVAAGSDAGASLLAQLALAPATSEQQSAAHEQTAQAGASQQRGLPSRDLRDTLFARLNHPRWDDVAARCLSCANCTLVCPTCFCHGESDHPTLDGSRSDHVREWDSCFSPDHSYMAGIVIRDDTRKRYRQWLTHKLGSWHDQFGRSGCVGCGRCITWCPVGIDITEEAWAICGDHS